MPTNAPRPRTTSLQQTKQGNLRSISSNKRSLVVHKKVLGKAWEIPSPSVMKQRNEFRQNVHDQTIRHRRIIEDHHYDDNVNENDDKTTTKLTDDDSDNEGDYSTTRSAGTITDTSKRNNVIQLLRGRELFGAGNVAGKRPVGSDITGFVSYQQNQRRRRKAREERNNDERLTNQRLYD